MAALCQHHRPFPSNTNKSWQSSTKSRYALHLLAFFCFSSTVQARCPFFQTQTQTHRHLHAHNTNTDAHTHFHNCFSFSPFSVSLAIAFRLRLQSARGRLRSCTASLTTSRAAPSLHSTSAGLLSCTKKVCCRVVADCEEGATEERVWFACIRSLEFHWLFQTHSLTHTALACLSPLIGPLPCFLCFEQ